jgi:microcystin-dependent protein
MAQSYVGEIRMFGGNFAPVGWAFCDGSLLAISDNDTLFNLIGTTFGGDGQSTFALPDLRGRVPIHQGSAFVIGQTAGAETVTLNLNQIPLHNHVPLASSNQGDQSGPANGVWAASNPSLNQFSSAAPSVNLDRGALQMSGGSQPHDNMMPFLAVNFIISLFGVFPSQS